MPISASSAPGAERSTLAAFAHRVLKHALEIGGEKADLDGIGSIVLGKDFACRNIGRMRHGRSREADAQQDYGGDYPENPGHTRSLRSWPRNMPNAAALDKTAEARAFSARRLERRHAWLDAARGREAPGWRSREDF